MAYGATVIIFTSQKSLLCRTSVQPQRDSCEHSKLRKTARLPSTPRDASSIGVAEIEAIAIPYMFAMITAQHIVVSPVD